MEGFNSFFMKGVDKEELKEQINTVIDSDPDNKKRNRLFELTEQINELNIKIEEENSHMEDIDKTSIYMAKGKITELQQELNKLLTEKDLLKAELAPNNYLNPNQN